MKITFFDASGNNFHLLLFSALIQFTESDRKVLFCARRKGLSVEEVLLVVVEGGVNDSHVLLTWFGSGIGADVGTGHAGT